MEFKRFELEEIFEKIKELLKYVDEKRLIYSTYFLYLANLPNGEKLEYKITKESIPHLLGINTTYLISTGLYKNTNSYEVVKEMLEDPYRVYNLAKQGKLDYNMLFSKHIDKKIKCFIDNINVDSHEIEAVSIYMSERTYTESETSEKFEYVIIKKYQNGNRGLLCLAKNNEGVYVPMSNQILETDEEIDNAFKKILKNQEITILTGIQAKEFPFKSYITLDEQEARLYKFQEYKEKYNVSIDVSNNYLYYIGKLKSNRELFSQSEETSKYIQQSQELERLRKKIETLENAKIELENMLSQTTQKNQELTEQVETDKKFKTKFLKLAKELEK